MFDLNERATDDEAEAELRRPNRWSYIVRAPNGTICAWGRGKRARSARGLPSSNTAATRSPGHWDARLSLCPYSYNSGLSADEVEAILGRLDAGAVISPSSGTAH